MYLENDKYYEIEEVRSWQGCKLAGWVLAPTRPLEKTAPQDPWTSEICF
jgi:hypothetical protein